MLKLNFKRIAALSAAFLICCLNISAFAENFVIDNFSVDVKVGTDRVYDITETIDVNFTQPSHGIMRKIPRSGSVEAYRITDASVTGDFFATSADSDYLTLKIGDEDEYVRGKHSYNISYKMIHAKDDATDGDYAYINLIGSEWEVPIYNAEMKLSLPTDKIEVTGLTVGSAGSAQKSDNYTITGNTITVSGISLSPSEGVTIIIKMPEGTFADAPDSLYPGAGSVGIILLIIAVLLLVAVFVLFFIFGRDEKVVPVVEFYPPDKLNPAEISYAADMKVTQRDATSMIFYWASEGLLVYEQLDKKNFVLHKTGDISDSAPSYERAAFNALWRHGEEGKVTNEQLQMKYYPNIKLIQDGAKSSFCGERRLDNTASSKISWLSMFLSIIISLTPIIAAVAYGIFDSIDGLIIGAISVVVNFIVYLMFTRGENMAEVKPVAARIMQIGFLAIGLAGAALIALMCSASGYVSYGVLFATFGLCVISCAGSAFIGKRSEYGVKILGRVLGFRNFLQTAEKERMEALIEQDSEYFYNILPYALALGVSETWAKKFDGLITEPPSWYRGYGYDTFTTLWLISSMNRSMMYMQSTAVSAPNQTPSSGSFGGGGFVGGGSGGGGGSSW